MGESVPLQHRGWYPDNPCYGCGPDNPRGIHLETHVDAAGIGRATWVAEEHHQGPHGVVNGGVVAVPMDCHGMWTAIAAFRRRAEEEGRDPTGIAGVTGSYEVRLVAPTPVGERLRLRAEVDRLEDRRAHVHVETVHDDVVTATFDGVFFEVTLDLDDDDDGPSPLVE